ncbi:MAG: GerMN domain-containing protein [Acidobacteria bacterium]|nr:GerMN domain-containing protein [Acidobacteriota bacterium]
MRHKWIIVGMVALLVVSLAGILTVYWMEKQKSESGAAGAGGLAAGDVKDRSVKLYFRSPSGKGFALLRLEARSILAPVDNRLFVRKLIDELKSGSRFGNLETLPKDVVVREVYLVGKQAILDFSRELCTQHPGGTTEELATLYSIVNTLTGSLPEINTVHILVEGRRRETLAGGISLDQGLAFSGAYLDGAQN